MGRGLLARGGAYRKKRTPLCRGFAKEWGGLLGREGAYRKKFSTLRALSVYKKNAFKIKQVNIFISALRAGAFGVSSISWGGLLARRGAYYDGGGPIAKKGPLCVVVSRRSGGAY